MTDIVTAQKRSEMMRNIRSRNTNLEQVVRRFLHRKGYRFRLHSKTLPGSPDIVLPKHRLVIMVHGCFWHRHEGCKLAYTPKSNLDRWQRKFDANQTRDQIVQQQLEDKGWKVITLWECTIRDSSFRKLLEQEGLIFSH